jgi:hypothetical protein
MEGYVAPPSSKEASVNEDALVKLGLESLLGPFTTVRTQHPVQPPAQFVDVFIASEAADPDAMVNTLGVLGRMVPNLALIEAFTSDVSLEDARACLRKQLTLHHSMELEAQAQAREGEPLQQVPMPMLWFLTWSKPRKLLRSWGMLSSPDWPPGVYLAPDGFAVGVVVLPELPKTRETLPLRMFGDERVRQGLRQELEALEAVDPMRQALDQMLTLWTLWVRGQPDEERMRRWLMSSMMMQFAQQELKKLQDEAIQEGRQEGRQEGLRGAVELACEVLGISLDEERRAHLAGLDLAGLEALKQHLKTHRSWPAG